MNRDDRLLHSSGNALTRQLLEAGLRDKPPASALPAVASALGLDLSSAPTPVDSTPGAEQGIGEALTHAAGETGALATAGATTGPAMLAAKWLVIGAVVGGATAGGGLALQETLREPPTAPTTSAPTLARRADTVRRAPTAAPVKPERAPEAPEVETPRPTPTRSSVPLGGASTRGAVRAREPVASAPAVAEPREPRPAPSDDAALAREARWIDAARAALARGDLSTARARLDEYDAFRRVGVLDREALVLRIEILARQGELERATALVERFAASYPGDPLLTRLRDRLRARPR